MNATVSPALTGCGNAASADVWFSFTATAHYPTIALTALGVSLTAAVPYIQLYSAPSCVAGVFTGTSIGCVSGTSLQVDTIVGGTGLTIGATYYIRIYTGSAGPFTSGTWQFRICITDNAASSPTVQYGKSYVNITKGVNGGTVEPGDTLEMRTTFLVSANTAYNVSLTGNIPANTTYVTNSLNILTNEGQLYKHWTDAADGDAGTISGSTVTINIGKGASGTNGGTLKSSYRPTLFGSQCLVVAAYRVVVNAVAYGTVINIGGGTLSYANTAGTLTSVGFPTVNAMLYKNTGICTNTVGSNGVLSEFGGTFGSGNAKNRFASTKVPPNYTYIPLATGAPGDNFYGISNNTSPGGANYSFNPADPVALNHIFKVWDIIGDHTGAVSPTAGNPPTDTTGGKTGGYMVVVNAAFRTDTAFLDTVKNLCPNTYYEYSTWFRNICKLCSGDSAGKSPTAAGYVPTVAGPPGFADSSGVHPNLTFNINGYDYYTTGDILYTSQWVKKGFTYLTGPSETQMVISIRNNAPGGGGNDWVMDDIGVATCTPNLVLNPSTPTVNVCYGDGASLSADVKSFFDNYTEYIWEKSIDNGVSWTNTGYSGTGSPLYNGTEYVYTAVGPSFIGDSTTHNNIFRLRVASTSTNLADANCSFAGIRTVQVYVNNCMWLLKADFLNAGGTLHNNFSTIQWQTANENGKLNFEVEKSTDGVHFNLIGTVKGSLFNGNASYSFNDPEAVTGNAYYRIKLKEETGFKYSQTILLSPGKLPFMIKNLVNPFSSTISCNVILPADGEVRTTVFDMYGRVVNTLKQSLTKGLHAIQIQDLGALSNGTYLLKTEWQNESIINKVIKSN
ncbi:MAG: T9SS type A sorting domain-containing protein [Bacteroidota bacterium]